MQSDVTWHWNAKHDNAMTRLKPFDSFGVIWCEWTGMYHDWCVQSRFWGRDDALSNIPCIYKLDMLTAHQCLKSPWWLSGTSTHPTMVTLKSILWSEMEDTSFSFHVNQPSLSWDKAIQNSDLGTWKSSTQGHECGQSASSYSQPSIFINSLPFHFTSIRQAISEIQLFRNLTFKHPWSRSWVRLKVKVT